MCERQREWLDIDWKRGKVIFRRPWLNANLEGFASPIARRFVGTFSKNATLREEQQRSENKGSAQSHRAQAATIGLSIHPGPFSRGIEAGPI